jgi:hypothetical protein
MVASQRGSPRVADALIQAYFFGGIYKNPLIDPSVYLVSYSASNFVGSASSVEGP